MLQKVSHSELLMSLLAATQQRMKVKDLVRALAKGGPETALIIDCTE